MNVNIEPSWKQALVSECEQSYFQELTEFVRSEYQRTMIYPPPKQIFSAFGHCPFDKDKTAR